jgi:hypothetical protein
MRVSDHVIHCQQRIRGIDWLLVEHVERGSGNAAMLQHVDQRFLVDDRSCATLIK